jgi:diguanylate cyclase (GGDEF)-like protein
MERPATKTTKELLVEHSPPPAEFEAAFREENRLLFQQRTRFLLKASLFFYPAFWFLDLALAPELAVRFLGIRVAVSLLYLLSLAAVRSQRGVSLAQPVATACALASAAGISIMSAHLGGFASSYFAGNMIVLFVICVFLPWELGMAALVCGLILALYLGINLAVHGLSLEMVGPLFFLLGSAVFTWLAALSSRQTRRQDLSVRLRLAAANVRIEETSLTDALTQLRNRRFLEQALGSDLDLAARRHVNGRAGDGEADLVFLLLDMDHFKSVNDSHGHAAGDAVLVQVAALLRSVFRASDHVVRWGGEEFLIVARFVDRKKGPDLAEKVRAAVDAHDFRLDDGTLLKRTCSVGFAAYPFSTRQPRACGWQEIVEIADRGLYAAKRKGRNGWVGLEAGDTEDPLEAMQRLRENPESSLAGLNPTLLYTSGTGIRNV